MRKVGSRELENRLGKYLRAVRQGQTLIITDRGKAVAQVGPATHKECRRWHHRGQVETIRRPGPHSPCKQTFSRSFDPSRAGENRRHRSLSRTAASALHRFLCLGRNAISKSVGRTS